MNTSAVYPSSNEESSNADWTKNSLKSVKKPPKRNLEEELVWKTAKLQISKPSLAPWTSTPRFWNPESWGFSLLNPKTNTGWVSSILKVSPICPNLPQFLAVSPLNWHTSIIRWVFIIVRSLYCRHRIIIWSQRLDVIKKRESDESSKSNRRGFARTGNVCFRKRR